MARNQVNFNKTFQLVIFDKVGSGPISMSGSTVHSGPRIMKFGNNSVVREIIRIEI